MQKRIEIWYNIYVSNEQGENTGGGIFMNLVITMSRRFGTGASMIAEELSKKLGIPVYDKAYIEQELEGDSYASEAEVIRELATHSCIILGRCASEILKDQENVFNIYVVAEYYYQNTGKVWGDVNNYHMILDTSRLGRENCADILIKYFERIEII